MNYNKIHHAQNILMNEKLPLMREELKTIALSMSEEEFKTLEGYVHSLMLRAKFELEELRKERND